MITLFFAGRGGYSRPVGFLLATYWFRQPGVFLSFNSPPSCRIYTSMNCASIGSDNGLSPVRHQAIISTITGLLSIGPLVTIVSEILFEAQNFSFMKMHLKISSAIWRPFCPVGRWVNVAPLVPQKCLPASSVSSSCKEMTSSCFESARPTCRHMNLKAARLMLASKLSSHKHFPHR